MEQLNYNLLFRWFVGLEMDDPVWDVTVFTKNRERLIAGAASQQLLLCGAGRGAGARSAERRAFHGGRHADSGLGVGAQLQGEAGSAGAGRRLGSTRARCSCATRWSRTTDPDARLYKKATADKAVPAIRGTR